MNVKEERIQERARTLSAKAGKDMPPTIEEALDEKHRRHQEEEGRETRIAEALAFIKSLGPPPPGLTSDHSDLYDEDGLPI